MSRPLRIQYPDAYYHVTCRGNERRMIFRNSEDQKEFFRLLSRSVDVFEVCLLAYALMPNHFHLLLCTPKANLSEFMRHFNISYTSAFNRKYNRTGHLYQGRYKAFLVDENNYLLEVSRYIHLNPLRIKSRIPLEKKWQQLLTNDSTSLPGYLNLKRRKSFVHYKTILDYFGGKDQKSSREYKKFMVEALGKDVPTPLEIGKGSGIIGKENFVEKIKAMLSKDQYASKSHREQPALRELDKSTKPNKLIDQYAHLVNMDRADLTTKGRQSPERAMLMELLYRFCNIKQPEIGKLMGGIDYSAVSQARSRLRLKVQHEPEWGKRFSQIQNMLTKCQE